MNRKLNSQNRKDVITEDNMNNSYYPDLMHPTFCTEQRSKLHQKIITINICFKIRTAKFFDEQAWKGGWQSALAQVFWIFQNTWYLVERNGRASRENPRKQDATTFQQDYQLRPFVVDSRLNKLLVVRPGFLFKYQGKFLRRPC